MNLSRGPYTISTDMQHFNVLVMYRYLAEESYWAGNLSMTQFDLGLKNSLVFGLYREGQQIGMGRVITDYATFAHIKDVFVLEEHQGQGLGKWLIESMLQHPALAEVTRWQLMTLDAHALYARFGFKPLDYPRFHMERLVIPNLPEEEP